MEGCNFPRGKGKRKRNGEREEGDIGGSVARGNLIRRIIQTQGEFIFAGTPIIRDFWWIGSIINSSERSFLSRNGDWLYIKRTGSRGNECTYTCNECLNSNRRFPPDDVCLWNTLSVNLYPVRSAEFPATETKPVFPSDRSTLSVRANKFKSVGTIVFKFFFHSFSFFLPCKKKGRIRGG